MNLCPICNEPTTITDDTFFKWQECKRKCISRCVGFSERLKGKRNPQIFTGIKTWNNGKYIIKGG